jgi:hypothetical protein
MSATIYQKNCIEKNDEVVLAIIMINKLMIPDVLIDIIKDYLYICKEKVLERFYRQLFGRCVNNDITRLILSRSCLLDNNNRQRIVHWAIAHYDGVIDVQIQSLTCVTCGEYSQFHRNFNGCCVLDGDVENEELLLYSKDIDYIEDEINDIVKDIDDIVKDIDDIVKDIKDMSLF